MLTQKDPFKAMLIQKEPFKAMLTQRLKWSKENNGYEKGERVQSKQRLPKD